jgi:membrane complex biogenesis BtpA family protein
MKDLFQKEFGCEKFIIGCVHAMPLPGSPSFDRTIGMQAIINRAVEEAKILQDAGFHGLLYVNEFDMPYEMTVPSETVAAMTALVVEAQQHVNMPHGLNMLLDPPAAMAICYATGGRYLRGYVTGAMAGDYGVWQGQGPKTVKLRNDLDAHGVKIIANITPGFSDSLDKRPLAQLARGAVFSGKADVLCVSGGLAGTAAPIEELKEVVEVAPDIPLVAGTGINEDNLEEFLAICDGIIIATSVKLDQKLENMIDPVRAKRFMNKVRELGY